MRQLHIVQGGVENGDKSFLERAARRKTWANGWIVPKSVQVDDDIVIFIRGFGFFATARVATSAEPREGWLNRYSAGLKTIRLIAPAISLSAIRRGIPSLIWAIYPRSITTPEKKTADRIRTLIADRRRTGLPRIDDASLAEASLDELRKVALLNARSKLIRKETRAVYRARSLAIRLYVLRRANGRCESCGARAPFAKPDGTPYLEPHHTSRLADDGPDHPAKVIAVCPNCHRHAHYAEDSKLFNDGLKKKLSRLEPPR